MTNADNLLPGDPRRPVLTAFMATLVPLLRQEFRADCCIAAVRLTQAILARFDLEITPYPVRVAIFNAAFTRRIEQGAPWPGSAEETRRWAAEDGSWTIGIGGGPTRPGRWAGHLVALIRGTPPLLCDLTLPQANRPARQIILPALLHPVPHPPTAPGSAWWGTTLNGTMAGQEQAVLQGHSSLVEHAAFSPNGQVVVTTSLDGTARLWDVMTRSERTVLRGHTGPVEVAVFSPGRTIVAMASFDAMVHRGSGIPRQARRGPSCAVIQTVSRGCGSVPRGRFWPPCLRIPPPGAERPPAGYATRSYRAMTPRWGHRIQP